MTRPEAETSAGWRPEHRLLLGLLCFWVVFELFSLRLGLLRPFFYDTLQAQVQGIDYFSLPKAWSNLRAGRSLYGSFDPPGPGVPSAIPAKYSAPLRPAPVAAPSTGSSQVKVRCRG